MQEAALKKETSVLLVSIIMSAAVIWFALQPVTLHAHDGPHDSIAQVGVSGSASVRAEMATSTPKRTFLDKIKDERTETKAKIENLRDEGKERVQAIKANVEERRADAKRRFEANVETRIKLHTAKVVNRMNAALDRLMGIGDRIDSRIEKLGAAGANVTEVKQLREESKVKLGEAKVKIAGLKAAIEAEISTSTPANPGEGMQRIKTVVKEAEESLKAAHRSIVAVIESLKKIRVTTSATTTTSVSN